MLLCTCMVLHTLCWRKLCKPTELVSVEGSHMRAGNGSVRP